MEPFPHYLFRDLESFGGIHSVELSFIRPAELHQDNMRYRMTCITIAPEQSSVNAIMLIWYA